MLTLEPSGAGTRFVFTALHRSAAELETNRTSGFMQGTEVAIGQLGEVAEGLVRG